MTTTTTTTTTRHFAFLIRNGPMRLQIRSHLHNHVCTTLKHTDVCTPTPIHPPSPHIPRTPTPIPTHCGWAVLLCVNGYIRMNHTFKFFYIRSKYKLPNHKQKGWLPQNMLVATKVSVRYLTSGYTCSLSPTRNNLTKQTARFLPFAFGVRLAMHVPL